MTRRVSTGSGSSSSSFAYPELGHEFGKPDGLPCRLAVVLQIVNDFLSVLLLRLRLAFWIFLGEFEQAALG